MIFHRHERGVFGINFAQYYDKYCDFTGGKHMEAYRKYSPGRCGPTVQEKEKKAYQKALEAVDVFAAAFCSFFEQEKKKEKGNENESRIMKQIVAELPLLLQSETYGTGESEEENSFSSLDAGQKSSDCHKLSAVLADACHIPREAALAIMMTAWCKFMLRSKVEWLADFAKKVWDVSEEDVSVWTIAQEGIARFQNFLCQCGLAVTLREYGIYNFDSRRMAEEMIRKYGEGVDKISLKEEDIQSVYELARG